MTAGTIFHRTRTALPKWFLAAYLMGVAYQTAWTITHKLRHGLTEDAAYPLSGFLETDVL